MIYLRFTFWQLKKQQDFLMIIYQEYSQCRNY